MSRNARIGPILILLAASGCATLPENGQPLVPTRHQVRTGPYVVYTNFPLDPDAPAIRQLESLDRRVGATLGVRVDPRTEPIEVFILNDRRAFTHFLTYYYPEFPPRRAFFLAQGNHRVVYTFLGDRLEEDLRHEATHALLHAAVGAVPLWLDEGLAEYFEGPDDNGGANPEHLGRLPDDLAGGWKPDLHRLEGLKDVRKMTPRDYRESWAWVHYFLNGSGPGKAALLAYLNDLRAVPVATPLSERLGVPEGDENPRMLAHLEEVREHPLAALGPPRDSTVRLQSAPTELAEASSRHRSILSRIRDLFRHDPDDIKP